MHTCIKKVLRSKKWNFLSLRLFWVTEGKSLCCLCNCFTHLINSVPYWHVKILSWKQLWINFIYVNINALGPRISWSSSGISNRKLEYTDSKSSLNLCVQPQAVNNWLLKTKPKCKCLLTLRITKGFSAAGT